MSHIALYPAAGTSAASMTADKTLLTNRGWKCEGVIAVDWQPFHFPKSHALANHAQDVFKEVVQAYKKAGYVLQNEETDNPWIFTLDTANRSKAQWIRHYHGIQLNDTFSPDTELLKDLQRCTLLWNSGWPDSFYSARHMVGLLKHVPKLERIYNCVVPRPHSRHVMFWQHVISLLCLPRVWMNMDARVCQCGCCSKDKDGWIYAMSDPDINVTLFVDRDSEDVCTCKSCQVVRAWKKHTRVRKPRYSPYDRPVLIPYTD